MAVVTAAGLCGTTTVALSATRDNDALLNLAIAPVTMTTPAGVESKDQVLLKKSEDVKPPRGSNLTKEDVANEKVQSLGKRVSQKKYM